ncbi:unannotated protein [freshwater metagenome]|uniref:Unannotated protein n=1 Tax=freshwater metagenome TaxID=449393 RepID=A0A6J7ELZ4_9ZZZZ|nr:hypothetical protein [Actinomycetota bacterium]
MTAVNVSTHIEPDEVVGASVMSLTNGVYALKFGTTFWSFSTMFINKQQLTDLCRDMEVIYMTEVQGASEQDVRM